ncbi:MAG: M14 family metallocarboxypeptidase, partial [Nitrospinae bacterium]|nr:M14 family metallocarboxypeptidase [Nitrospinota bacterium]
MLKRKRDHSKIIRRLIASVNGAGHISTLGEVSTSKGNYPIQKIVLGEGKPRRALISAGIHGDEPAGVETVCAFLESGKYRPFLDTWELTILPCINPYGFEHDTRENHEERDLNRLFKEKTPPLEVALAQSVVTSSSYDLTLELHEDCESSGYYLYEKARPPRGAGLGFRIIDAVKDLMPINMDAEIEGTPSDGGVIHRLKDPEEMEWWPMALYALANGSTHCLTLETATHFPMQTRIDAHMTALETALNG